MVRLAIATSTVKSLLFATLLTSQLAAAGDTVDQTDTAFSLPAGNYMNGKQAFIDLQCTACHNISNVDLPDAEEMSDVAVVLAKPTFSKSELELVTALINPSHSLIEGLPVEAIYSDGESKMPIFNDLMTVTQLIDIVTFLRANDK